MFDTETYSQPIPNALLAEWTVLQMSFAVLPLRLYRIQRLL